MCIHWPYWHSRRVTSFQSQVGLQFKSCGRQFFLNGPISASFCLFLYFLVTISIQIEKSIDGVLGIRTWGHRTVGADETMELWQPPLRTVTYLTNNHTKILVCCYLVWANFQAKVSFRQAANLLRTATSTVHRN